MANTYDPKVELYLGNAWVDVSGDTRYRQRVTITRGRDNEGGQGQPTICSFTLDNGINGGNGKYNPDDPTGIYYGTFGRNTPCRVSKTHPGGVRAVLGPSTQGYVSTPDSAGLSITGDIDLRADIGVKNYRSSQAWIPIWKLNSYRMQIQPDGFLRLVVQTDAGGTERSFYSTVQLPHAPGRLSIRATLDVDNGGSGATAVFYTSTTAGTAGPWTTLGASVTTAGTLSIYDSPGVCYVYSGAGSVLDVYSVAIYSGIAGTLRANPRFDQQASSGGAASFADAQANTWTVNYPSARLDDRDFRFWGEISEWPRIEDSTGRDRTIAITASGQLRRLQANGTALQSAMSRAIENLATAVAWWPGEDGAQSTQIASGIERQPAFTVLGPDALTYGAENTLFPGTASMIGIPSNMRMTTNIATYTNTNKIQFRFLLLVPSGGFLDNTVMWSLYTTGTAARWDLYMMSSGGMGLAAYDAAGNVLNSLSAGFSLVSNPVWVSIEMSPSGSDITANIATINVTTGAAGGTGFTVTGRTVGIVNRIQFNWANNDFSDALIGQVLLENDISVLSSLTQQIRAYSGETVEPRIKRLIVTEAGLRHDRNGTLPTTADNPLGYQTQKSVADLLRECEDLDLGILTDMRSFDRGLEYRSKDSMYGQDAALTLGYTSFDLVDLQNTSDDQRTQNDVTVSRANGSSSNVVDTTSPMSVNAPGSGGVGRYEESYELSLAADSQAKNQAGWRLHMGTILEPRWTTIEVWAERPELASTADQLAITGLNLGDRITVTNVPLRRLLWDIDAIVIGVTEELDQLQWHHRFITIPERAFRVLEWNTDRRWSPGLNSSGVGSTLASSATSSATSLSVASASGLWTTTDVPFDILVAGERITVTAVTGSSSPQTFTVTRAVNAVSKAQVSGAAVELWDPSYWAV